MNFGKLLAAGRSIINGRGSLAYRENKNVYVPKFEPPKNTWAKGGAAAGPAATPAPAAGGTPVKHSAVHGRPARPARWPGPLNPLAIFRGATVASGRPVSAVQTELRLDAVKVLHNDLRDPDAEVEVVPIKSRPARGAAAREPEGSWSDLEAGLFGVKTV